MPPSLRTPRRSLAGILLPAWGAIAACGQATPEATPDPDCTALAAAAERAAACDPELANLARTVRQQPDPIVCQQAALSLLYPPSAGPRPVRSLYAPDPSSTARPLRAAEREALLALPLPGFVTVVPDIRPRAGRPTTRASIRGRALEEAAAGVLEAAVTPGQNDLVVRHADQTHAYCLTAHHCQRLELHAHGVHLAPHAQVTDGPCDPPSTIATDGEPRTGER